MLWKAGCRIVLGLGGLSNSSAPHFAPLFMKCDQSFSANVEISPLGTGVAKAPSDC